MADRATVGATAGSSLIVRAQVQRGKRADFAARRLSSRTSCAISWPSRIAASANPPTVDTVSGRGAPRAVTALAPNNRARETKGPQPMTATPAPPHPRNAAARLRRRRSTRARRPTPNAIGSGKPTPHAPRRRLRPRQ